MTKKLVDIGPAMKKIRDTGDAMPLIDPTDLAAALGAEIIPQIKLESGNPLSLYALRAEIFRRLQSSGGRPALEGATRRTKIPVSDQEWHDLESIAAAITQEGCTPSAGQVASVLLNLALRSVLDDLAKEPSSTKEKLRGRLAQTTK
jgi:hypothetical protein